MPRDRSPNLDGDQIAAIVRIVKCLPGQPTWQDVVEKVQAELGARYAWKALGRHDAVRLALRARRNGAPARRPSGKHGKKDDTERLGAELKACRALNEALMERDARRSYNAYACGVTEEDLDRPLPRIDRT